MPDDETNTDTGKDLHDAGGKSGGEAEEPARADKTLVKQAPEEGTTPSAGDVAKAAPGLLEPDEFEVPRLRRVTPLTIVLLVIFALSAMGLVTVLNLKVVRDYFQGEGVFWVLRVGLMLMLAAIIVAVIVREVANLQYVEGVLENMIDANKRLKLLMEAGRDIGSTLDLGEILLRVLAYASDVTGADIGAVYLWDKAEDVLRLAVVEGVDESKVMFKELPMRRGLVGEAASRREMVVLDSTESIDERDNVFFGAAEPHSHALVPLVARGKFLGMLVAANSREHSYSEEEKRLLDGLAELASLSITNAELYRIARKSLDALSRERGVTDSVLDEMVAGVITADAKGRIGIFNREAQRVTGYTFAEKTQALLRPETSLDQNPLGPLEHGMLEVLENPTLVREGDALIMKTDRSLLSVSYRIYPLMNGPEVIGAACVFMEARGSGDEPARKGGSVDFHVLLRSLGGRIEKVYTFPLSRVIERLRGMTTDDWAKAREDVIATLEAGYSTLLGLLEDLEQYLNCTTTREWDTPAEYDLTDMTAEVVRDVLASPDAEGVLVSVKMSGLPPVYGFERMIRTALEQVIENACIAASIGEKRVVVTGSDEGGFVRLEVADTGPGLSAETREFMYMPFFTMWEGRSGLGLSMVKRVMQRLGGRVGVAEGKGGALFFLEFPKSPGRTAEDTGDESAADAASG
jgi:signal transduction histidine kinase